MAENYFITIFTYMRRVNGSGKRYYRFDFIAVEVIFFWQLPIGLLRLPDLYNRIHAMGKCDTLGAGLILWQCLS